jgi:hypothetical protein
MTVFEKQVNYNMKSADRFKWDNTPLVRDPAGFIAGVIAFQTREGLTPDGLVGPKTYRAMMAEKELIDEPARTGSGFVVNGRGLMVPFRYVGLGEDGNLSLVAEDDFRKRETPPTSVVWHWDVTLSAAACRRVLANRDYSSHGCIDNDGTFYQFLDPGKHVAWHAGDANEYSIGVDITNVVTIKPKYDSYYRRNFGARPKAVGRFHGRRKKIFGWYPAQVETAAGFAAFANKEWGIPLTYPKTDTVVDNPRDYGHLAHLHLTTNKWDVAGFPFARMIKRARQIRREL